MIRIILAVILGLTLGDAIRTLAPEGNWLSLVELGGATFVLGMLVMAAVILSYEGD